MRSMEARTLAWVSSLKEREVPCITTLPQITLNVCPHPHVSEPCARRVGATNTPETPTKQHRNTEARHSMAEYQQRNGRGQTLPGTSAATGGRGGLSSYAKHHTNTEG